MSFDFSTLVTDRNQGDLEALRSLLATPLADWTAEQLEKFKQAVSKGAYNYTDLNRVTACMDDLNGRLTAAGYVTGYHPIIISHKAMAPKSLFPDGYIELEYIESTGVQHIDTGFVPDQDTRLIMEATPTSVAEAGDGSGFIPYGAAESYTDRSFECYSSLGQYEFNYDGQYRFVGVANVGESVIIDHNKNAISLTVENQSSLASNFTYVNFVSPYTLYLFATHRFNALHGFLKLKYCKIYNGNQLIRNFVPCKNLSGEIGLYDFVGQEFYENSGSGMFLAGPEIPKPDPDPALDPIWYEDDTPTTTQMYRFLQNVSALRSVLKLPEDTAPVPSDMVGLTLTEANNIESILDTIQEWIVNMQAAWFFSGDLYSGEV